MSKSRKIYISSNNKLYKFLSYVLQDLDGSLYIIIERSGTNKGFVEFDSKDYQLKYLTLDNGRDKRKQISYHASGCVRYHNVRTSPNYFEPIIGVTQPNVVAAFIVPRIDKLDISDKTPTDEDFVIPVNWSSESKIQFTFIIAPWNMQFSSAHIAIRYKDMFSFILQISESEINIPLKLENHFTFATPNRGLFDQQVIDKENALIRFHQKTKGTRDLIIYSPNMEGVYKIICAVPMRIPPGLFVKFEDNAYSSVVVSKTVSVVRFKVKDKHNNTVKKEVAISEISLDAEL